LFRTIGADFGIPEKDAEGAAAIGASHAARSDLIATYAVVRRQSDNFRGSLMKKVQNVPVDATR
jgi:hypothetical protein